MVPIALALIAPWITRRWQDRQRDSQTKTELVAEISGLVMTTVMTVHLFKTRPKRQSDNSDSQELELERIYKKWRVETCIVGSKMHAYFPDPKKGDKQVHRKWHYFSDRLTRYYEDSRDTDNKKSSAQSEKDKEDLFKEKARIIEEILASKITGFLVGKRFNRSALR
jgi:hypothetical protein